MPYTIEFIGGIADGKIIAWDSLPPEIHLPIMPKLDLAMRHDSFMADMPLQIDRAVYRRLVDTQNYIYVRTA